MWGVVPVVVVVVGPVCTVWRKINWRKAGMRNEL